MRGNCSPTSISTMRVPPKPVRIDTIPLGSDGFRRSGVSHSSAGFAAVPLPVRKASGFPRANSKPATPPGGKPQVLSSHRKAGGFPPEAAKPQICTHSLLNQPIPFRLDRILAVMTTPTLPVVLSRLGHYQSNLNGVSQTNQSVRKFCCSVKRFNLIPKMP